MDWKKLEFEWLRLRWIAFLLFPAKTAKCTALSLKQFDAFELSQLYWWSMEAQLLPNKLKEEHLIALCKLSHNHFNPNLMISLRFSVKNSRYKNDHKECISPGTSPAKSTTMRISFEHLNFCLRGWILLLLHRMEMLFGKRNAWQKFAILQSPLTVFAFHPLRMKLN